jgi:hypothetical protein
MSSIKKLTGQIRCKRSSDVVTTANYLAQQFKAQGWTAGKERYKRCSS